MSTGNLYTTRNLIVPDASAMMRSNKVVIQAATGGQVIDYSYDKSQDNDVIVQSLVIDTRALLPATASLHVQTGREGDPNAFAFDVPSGVFSSFNVLAFDPTVATFVVSTGATGSATVWLQNFPVLPQDYAKAATTSGTQNVNVTNASLPVTVSGTPAVTISGTPTVTLNGGNTQVAPRYALSVVAAHPVTEVSTAPWTAGNMSVRQLRAKLSRDATLTGGGTVNLVVHTGSGTMTIPFAVPATALADGDYTQLTILDHDINGTGYDTTTAYLSTALTTGSIIVTVSGAASV